MRRESATGCSPTTASLALLVCFGIAGAAGATARRIPQDFPGIQAAIDAAASGDTVLVSRGTYAGNLVIAAKTITLASNFVTTGDPDDIALTIIDGGAPILTLQATVGAATTVRGLTFRNGNYQLVNYARRVNILNDRFINGGGDALSFEGAGGLVRDCTFDHAGDDGIDSDNASDPTVENCTFLNCGDDGIELRLHSYTGPTLEIVFRGNVFTGCKEDGIQLIDYAGASSRTFRIERNVFANNLMVGLACMADGVTTENFAGAPLVEPVQVIGNTFSGNPYGLTGGDAMLVMNNIFTGSAQVGMKRVAASSLATYNDFWGNGTAYTTSNVVAGTTLLQDPLLNATCDLQPGSPCIDAGAASIVWNGGTVNAPPYSGAAPDLGAHETTPAPPVAVPPPGARVGLAISAVRPNPARNVFDVVYTLPEAGPARIELLDLSGRRVLARELSAPGPGIHVVNLQEARTLPAGVYLVRLSQGGRSRTTRCIVIR